MVRLIVMRHAKSDWNAGAETDHERPLNDRGRQEAPYVGKKLATSGYVPDYVLSSDSTRTTETFEAIRPYFPGVPVEFVRDLYHAGIDEVRGLLTSLPSEAKTVLVLGHNPGWEDMVSELAGKHVEMKTAYAAVLDSDEASLVLALERGRRMRLAEIVTPHD